MRRRTLLFVAPGLLAMFLSRGQAAGGAHRIGVLSRYVSRERFELIPAALQKLGYEEGKNVFFEYRFAEGRADRLAALASELVSTKVDVLVAMTNDDILAAKQATASIPIVMVFSLVPVEMGLVRSLSHPGGNVTGTTISAPETVGKMFEILREAVPKARHVAVLWEEGFPGMDAYRLAGEVAIEKLGMRWTTYPVHAPEDLERTFQGLVRARPDALYVVTTGVIFTHRARIIEFAGREHLPAFYTSDAVPPEGGLISYSADHAWLMGRTATYVDRILRGAKPADLPVEQPSKYRLIVNLKTARSLGHTLPRSILLRADQVIE
jgi:putative ABC transport system substrate-binding protein